MKKVMLILLTLLTTRTNERIIMRSLIALSIMLFTFPALSKEFRTIELPIRTITVPVNHDTLYVPYPNAQKVCVGTLNVLMNIISYNSDEGQSFNLSGICSKVDDSTTRLVTTIRTNLPSGTHDFGSYCMGEDIDGWKRQLAYLSKDELQLYLALDKSGKGCEKPYLPQPYKLKVRLR